MTKGFFKVVVKIGSGNRYILIDMLNHFIGRFFVNGFSFG